MITTEPFYIAICDNCGKQWEDTHNGICAMTDAISMKNQINDDGWHTGDGEEGDAGCHYCPDCFSYDDEDKFSLLIPDTITERKYDEETED